MQAVTNSLQAVSEAQSEKMRTSYCMAGFRPLRVRDGVPETFSWVPVPASKPAGPYSTVQEVEVPFSVQVMSAVVPVTLLTTTWVGATQAGSSSTVTLSICRSLSPSATVDSP